MTHHKLNSLRLSLIIINIQLIVLNYWLQNGSTNGSEEVKPAHKRIRMLSDSEPDSSPAKFEKLNVPLADDIEQKVSFLQTAYPDMDPMVLQDTLK